MSFSVNVVVNDSQLRQLLREFPDTMEDAINSLAHDGQAWVQDQFGSDGSPSAPGGIPGIDTGTLKNSISVELAGAMARMIVAGAEYAIPLEFGTSKMEARPFMLPMAMFLESSAEASMRNYLRF